MYLAAGIRLADPAFLAHDWWAAQTSHYHVVFAWLIAGLHGLGILPWGQATLSLAVTLTAMTAVWGIARSLRLAGDLAVALAACGLFFGLYYARTAGNLLFASPGLQAGTIGTACLLLATWMLLRGRDLASGLCLAAAAGMHVSVGMLGLLLFALVQVCSGWAGLPRRLLLQLGPGCVAMLAQAPVIWAVSGQDLPAELRATANTLLFDMLPHHYRPLTFLGQLADPMAWLLIVVPFVACVERTPARRRLRALLVVLSALLAGGALLTTVVFVPAVSHLMIWRLAPLLLLLCQVVAVATPLLLAAGAPVPDRPAARLVFFWAGLILLMLSAEPLWLPRTSVWAFAYGLLAAFYGIAVSLLLLSPDVRARARQALDGPRAAGVVLAGGLGFAVFAALTGGYNRMHFDLLLPQPEIAAERQLYAWARTTPADSQFLIPLNLQQFRLLGERAVVVDAKAIPFRPDELLEWHRRITAISQRRDPSLSGRFGYEAGYGDLTPDRVADLAAAYDIDFAVFRRGQGPALAAPVAYENDGFVAYAVAAAR